MKTALITGAGSGIGKSTALALLEAGYALVLTGRRREALESTVHEAPAGAQILVVPADITDPDSVQELFAQIQSAYGRLDLLFNNAGVNIPATPLEEVDFAQFNTVINTNVAGTFLCTQAAFRLMKSQTPQGGRIINNGSLSAHVPRPHAAVYNASKHDVSGLTISTALEGRRYHIACGQIDIGNAATNMTERMAVGVLQADGSLAAEPTMDVTAVARAVVYMASLPLDANVLTMTVMATQMPYVGRG